MPICYYCGAEATSREHVPPAGIFPEQKDLPNGVDYRKNLITVPSCEQHNSAKSKDDEYFLLIVALGYFNNKEGQTHFNTKIVRWLMGRPAILERLFSNQKPVIVDGEQTVAVDIESTRFTRAVEHISRGLYFHDTGRQWLEPIRTHTPMLLYMNDPKADKFNKLTANLCDVVSANLQGRPQLGDNPQVFWYRSFVVPEKRMFLYQMVFFEGFNVFGISHPKLTW